MSKKIVIIVIAVLLAAGAGAFALLAGQDNEQMAGTEDSQNTEMPTENDRYVAYSEAGVKNTDGRKLLFFHAPWCPQCNALEADIESNGVPEGFTIFKVDYDSATALKQRYSVTIQTTVVEVNKDGRQLKKTVPYDNPTMDYVLNELGV